MSEAGRVLVVGDVMTDVIVRPEGPHIEAYFKGFHVDPILVADPQEASGVLVVLVDADGERSFLTDRGANLALEPSDMPVWLLDETRRQGPATRSRPGSSPRRSRARARRSACGAGSRRDRGR
ncbi:hypothetical protein WMF42_41910 [Sorangium sp. So ce176]